MCKYLQNAPKTLANRRQTPGAGTCVVAHHRCCCCSCFCCCCCCCNCNSFVATSHIQAVSVQRYLCHSIFLWLLLLLPLPQFSHLPPTHFLTHVHTHTQILSVLSCCVYILLLLLCCHFCCRDIVSNIVVSFMWQAQGAIPMCVCVYRDILERVQLLMYMTYAIIILCSSNCLTLNISLIWQIVLLICHKSEYFSIGFRFYLCAQYVT